MNCSIRVSCSLKLALMQAAKHSLHGTGQSCMARRNKVEGRRTAKIRSTTRTVRRRNLAQPRVTELVT